jgi:FkbM family methyltransferase
MFLGLFEPTETRLIREILAPGNVLLDIGAHIGWFSVIGSKRVGAGGCVVAFEPYDANANALRENLRLNNCTNVRVVELALGSQAGTLMLSRPGGDSGAVTAVDWSPEGKFEVPVGTLDEVENALGEVSLLKIDVEGWESQVFRGASTTLSRTQFVIFEINGPAISKAGSSQKEVLEILRCAGFASFLKINEDALTRLAPSAVFNVLAVRAESPVPPTFWKDLGLSGRTVRRLKVLAEQ